MRSAAALLLLAALSFTTPAHAAPADAFGRWVTQSGNGHVDIAPCGQSACGTIVWGQGGPSTDTKNPNPALRSRPLIGVRILEGFRQAPNGWVNGRLYDPESGNSYRGEILPQTDGTLKVKGCVGPICRAQIWRRVRQ
jgi:uncharacterized protein (DUF2147 family)